MKSKLYEVTTPAGKTPGHLRGGWSHFEKKLGILPGALYGKVIRAPQGERATYFEAPFYPVEFMPLSELLELPACVYFANIGPRLGQGTQTCSRVRKILFNLNKNYLLCKVWQDMPLRSLIDLMSGNTRLSLRFGPYIQSKTIDSFYECLSARDLLPLRSTDK